MLRRLVIFVWAARTLLAGSAMAADPPATAPSPSATSADVALRSPTDTSAALADDRILDGAGTGLRVQSVMTRVSAFDQYGHGYQ